MKKLIKVKDIRGNMAIINTDRIISAEVLEFRNENHLTIRLDNNEEIVCNNTADEIYNLIYPPINQ